MKLDQNECFSDVTLEDRIADCNLSLEKFGRVGESRDERIWAAGFFDGEGHISARSKGGFDCAIDQIEEDLINLVRFRNAVGVGTLVALKDRDSTNHRPACRWTVTNQSDLQTVADMIGPFLNPTKLNGRSIQKKPVANPPNDGFARALTVPIRTILSRGSEMPTGAIGYEPKSKRSEPSER